MKRVVLMLLIWVIAISSNGQTKAIVYFQRLPAPLADPCEADSTRMYFMQLDTVSIRLAKDIKAREKEVNAYMKEHKQEMKETMMKNSGLTLTPEQIQKMKQDNKHMTQEQKMKLADEMMQQNANISMKEVQAMKKNANNKDTAALKGWSMAYATENMADQPADQAKIEAEKIKMKSTADLLKEQNDINTKLLAGGGKYTQLMDSLQKDADTAWMELQRQIAPVQAQIDTILAQWGREENKTEEGGKRVDGKVKELADFIYDRKKEYCPPFTERYIGILKGLIFYLPGTFSDCDRVDELNIEITYRQTGVRMPDSAKGLSALKAVKNYADMLSKVQKYKLVGHKNDNKSEIGAQP